MPPSVKCLRRIAPAAAMVNEFFETTQNTNKTQLLASKYGTFRALVISENFIPQNKIGAEELAVISSYQTLSADKK